MKNIRSERLISLGEELMKRFNSNFIDATLSVLLEEKSKKDKDLMEGYTTNYIRVKAKKDLSLIGQIVDVKIKEGKDDYLVGDITD